MAQLLIDDASRHLATASQALLSDDLSGAYQLAYDALRKCAASLLEAEGLRATSRGGHIAIQEAAIAQFGSTVRAFRSFGRIRRARNNFEYPSTVARGPSRDDVRDAIAVATQARDAAVKILEEDLLTPW
jgi:HEPN domain